MVARCQPLSPSRAGQRRVTDAFGQLVALVQAWATRGQSLLTHVLGDATQRPAAWQHWPPGDAHDPDAGFRWYYHGHPDAGRTRGEHGHFHLFADVRRGDDVSHLLAISVTPLGLPCGLFAPNRWVTGERWLNAAQVLPRLRRFTLQTPSELTPVHQWLHLFLRAFAPQAEALLHARDARLGELQQRLPSDVLEDRRVAVLSRCRIGLPEQARLLDRWNAPRSP